MKTDLKREEWMEKVLQSTEGVAPAATNPYLYQKILARLNGTSDAVSPKMIWVTAFGIILLMVINIAAIRQTSNERRTTSDASILVQDYHLNDEPLLAN